MLRIREWRKTRGLTQAQLADRACMSRSYLAEIEAGKLPVNTYRIDRLARELGVTPRDLYPENPNDSFLLKLRSLPPGDREQVEGLLDLLYRKLPEDHR
jgi:transcriptional regulator with XRE-family HTH domain